MSRHRIALIALVAALVALPLAYVQLNGVMEGADLLASTFGALDTRTAALD